MDGLKFLMRSLNVGSVVSRASDSITVFPHKPSIIIVP